MLQEFVSILLAFHKSVCTLQQHSRNSFLQNFKALLSWFAIAPYLRLSRQHFANYKTASSHVSVCLAGLVGPHRATRQHRSRPGRDTRAVVPCVAGTCAPAACFTWAAPGIYACVARISTDAFLHAMHKILMQQRFVAPRSSFISIHIYLWWQSLGRSNLLLWPPAPQSGQRRRRCQNRCANCLSKSSGRCSNTTNTTGWIARSLTIFFRSWCSIVSMFKEMCIFLALHCQTIPTVSRQFDRKFDGAT